MDLDGSGAGSPEGLVRLILQALPGTDAPIQIEALCRSLDISEIQLLDSEGYEGGLITDPERSTGIILVNGQAGLERRRFTIAHELGHFLIPTHIPNVDGRFLCSRKDMLALGAKEGDRRARMEAEANRFASLVLVPPPILRKKFAGLSGPGLIEVFDLAREFQVSKEVMARNFAEHYATASAVILVHDGKVIRSYRNRNFPYMAPSRGGPVPRQSTFWKINDRPALEGHFQGVPFGTWLGDDNPRADLLEQVILQTNGRAMIMLQLESPSEDDDDPDENQRLIESWRVGFRR